MIFRGARGRWFQWLFALSIGTKLSLSTVVVLGLTSMVVASHFIEQTRENLVATKAKAAGMIADLLAVALAPDAGFLRYRVAQPSSPTYGRTSRSLRPWCGVL